MPEFSPRKRMGRRSAILDPTNMQDCLIKVGLLPTKIDKLGRAEPVPESDQDHRRVTVALPVDLGRLDEALDLRRRQVLAGPQLPVRWTPSRAALRYCALFRFRADKFEARSHEEILGFQFDGCAHIDRKTHSSSTRITAA